MVLPLHDDNPVRRTPVLTYLLILLNAGIFLLSPISRGPQFGGQQTLASFCEQSTFYQQYGCHHASQW